MSLKSFPSQLLRHCRIGSAHRCLRLVATTRAQGQRYLSSNPGGVYPDNLAFVEEPLGFPASKGYGWPYLEFGEAIGPNERYIIRRKLGWGQSSSTWMAYDQVDNRFVAIKDLTGSASPMSIAQRNFEHLAYQQMLRHSPYAEHCLISPIQFTLQGRGSAGQHHCFVTDICGQNLMSMQNNMPHERFSVQESKHILLHVLRGISHAHQSGVIHTDIKPDNILVSAKGYTNEEINAILVSDPPRRHPAETSVDGNVEVAVSQPLILPIENAIQSHKFVLADWGSALNRPRTEYHEQALLITAPIYRSPEVILGQPWNEKVDIWSFGCLVFELVIGPPLFQLVKKFNLEPAEFVLQQMMVYMGERFDPNRLQKNETYHEYFDDRAVLWKNPPPHDWSLERSIRCYPFVSEEDIGPVVKFITRCLRLHPGDRPSADELLADPWFSGVE